MHIFPHIPPSSLVMVFSFEKIGVGEVLLFEWIVHRLQASRQDKYTILAYIALHTAFPEGVLSPYECH